MHMMKNGTMMPWRAMASDPHKTMAGDMPMPGAADPTSPYGHSRYYTMAEKVPLGRSFQVEFDMFWLHGWEVIVTTDHHHMWNGEVDDQHGAQRVGVSGLEGQDGGDDTRPKLCDAIEVFSTTTTTTSTTTTSSTTEEMDAYHLHSSTPLPTAWGSRAPRHTENPYCEMVTLLRPFVVQDPSLFSRLPGHKRVSISVSKEMEFLGMPGCPAKSWCNFYHLHQRKDLSSVIMPSTGGPGDVDPPQPADQSATAE
jgi:hypothetical protein